MPKRDVEFFIVDMLVALEVIQRYASLHKISDDLIRDEAAWSVTTRQLEIVGEAMKHVLGSEKLKNVVKHSWRNVVDFRNVVTHEYFGINQDQVFDIVKNDVPLLEKELIDMIKKFSDLTIIEHVIDETKLDLIQINRQASIEYLDDLKQMLKC